MRSAADTIREMLVDPLSTTDRDLLRAGAAPRYLTHDLAAHLTGSNEHADQLVGHFLLEPSRRRDGQDVWTLSPELRRALLEGFDGSDEIWQRVAEPGNGAVSHDALYAKIAATTTRLDGLAELSSAVEAALEQADVPAAHDLLRLLDEWPLTEDPDIQAVRGKLEPRLRQYGRADRDRETTTRYFERPFEQDLYRRLFAGVDETGGATPWLLDLHAPGGRGKTTFLKRLFGRYCPAHEIPVARIDFDYVANLTVSAREPWRLLLAIAEQLNPQLPYQPFESLLTTYGSFRSLLYNEALPRRKQRDARLSPDIEDDTRDAEQEVPRKLRREFQDAIGSGLVLIAVDTVENVLHSRRSELTPLLSALAHLHDGVPGQGPSCVPGLRVIVSGRVDLTGQRLLGDDEVKESCPGFVQNWIGANPTTVSLATNDVAAALTVGTHAMSFELPEFSRSEAHEFLTSEKLWGLPPGGMVDAIVDRCHDNPMKLALMAEHARDHGLTEDLVKQLPSVELVYLVDRVVDRIEDGRVQWLLRWGSLVQTLTRDVVEQIIWPTLVKFARAENAAIELGDEHAANTMDDANRDELPPSRHEIVRWAIPTLDEVMRPGAMDEAWDTLLDYAAESSWVFLHSGVQNAVEFHNEIRSPLRRLLHGKDRPVFDVIHTRALDFWHQAIERGTGQQRIVALGNAVYHAYQPYRSAHRLPADEVWWHLLNVVSSSRDEREIVASAVLDINESLDEENVTEPSAEVLAAANLELGEFLVAASVRSGLPLKQHDLRDHIMAIPDWFVSREPRRVSFLRAVYEDLDQNTDGAWHLVGQALESPAPEQHRVDHLELITGWAQETTPPRAQLDVARALADEAARHDIGVANAFEALARGLIACEEWRQATDAALIADHADLLAAASLGMGLARRVRSEVACSAEYSARAALQQYDPRGALAALDESPEDDDDQRLVVRGMAHAMLDEYGAAREYLGSAASKGRSSMATQANIELGRVYLGTGDADGGRSVFDRYTDSSDPVLRLRSLIEDAFAAVPFADENRFEVDAAAAALDWMPPSVGVAVQLVHLATSGVSSRALGELADALERVDAGGGRLLALAELDKVGAPTEPIDRAVAERLRTMTGIDVDGSNVTLLLIAAELDRVLGDLKGAARKLRHARRDETADPAVLDAAIREADQRLTMKDPFALDEQGESTADVTEDPVLIEISCERDGSFRFVTDVAPSDAEEFTGVHKVEPGPSQDGYYALLENRAALFDHLGSGIATEYVEHCAGLTSSKLLHLRLRDEHAAGWPWELATVDGDPLERHLAIEGLIRRSSSSQPPRVADMVVANRAHVESIGPIDERELRRRMPDDGRGLRVHHASTSPEPLRALDEGAGVVYIICEPIKMSVPAIVAHDRSPMTAERLARLLGDQPRLVVLDLVLDSAPTFAAEQLMIANTFCWHLHRQQPSCSFLMGVFDERESRVGRQAILHESILDGNSFDGLVTELRRSGLRDGDPLRDVVALTTDHANSRVRVVEVG